LIGVGIPKATRLYQILGENGVKLSKVPINSEEASQFLRKIITRD
jgi:hypothetical protein